MAPPYRPAPSLAATVMVAALSATLLAACAPGDDGKATGTVIEAPLPQPRQEGGAITDMPARPGPGEVPLAGNAPAPSPTLLSADERFGLPALLDNPETGLAEPAPAAPTPGPDDAKQVLRRYYAAINTRDFASAQAAWEEGSAAHTAAQLAEVFADAAVEITLGDPRAIDAAAGTRVVEVPVTVTTTRADGSVQQQAGRYTLRRLQDDGTPPTLQGWRIAAVDLRDAAR